MKAILINFLKRCETISVKEFGFLERLLTVDAMNKLISEVVEGLNYERKCIGVFMDLAKAFDIVPHEKLLEVLIYYGIRR